MEHGAGGARVGAAQLAARSTRTVAVQLELGGAIQPRLRGEARHLPRLTVYLPANDDLVLRRLSSQPQTRAPLSCVSQPSADYSQLGAYT